MRIDSRLPVILGIAVAVFFITLGEAPAAVVPLGAAHAMAAGVLAMLWFLQLRRHADLVDRLVLASLALVLVTAIFSAFPRMSLAPALTAVGLASAFGVARRTLADAAATRMLWVALALCGTGFIAGALLNWSATFLSWWLTMRTVPPLDMPLGPIGRFGHRYEVGILVAMLLPAFVVLAKPGWRTVLAAAGLMAGLLVILMSGGRSAWLGVVFGLLIPACIYALRSGALTARWAAGMAIGVVLIGIVAIPLIAPRLLAAGTVELRAAIWSASLTQWLERPLTGWGLGTFPTAITLSGFFDDNNNIARGPDGVVFQILAETGLLGMLGVALLLVALAVGSRQTPRRQRFLALSGVAVFGVSALTNDTTNVLSLVVVAILLAAAATPFHAVRSKEVAHGHHRPLGLIRDTAAGVMAALIAATFLLTTVASAQFEQARMAAANGEITVSRDHLEAAVATDPQYALYQRELGLALASDGRAASATEHLLTAFRLNPADAVAARSLSLTLLSLDQQDEAVRWAEAAHRLRPGEPANPLTLAYVAATAGRHAAAADALASLLALDPWLPGAPTWHLHFPGGDELGRLLVESRTRVGEAARFALAQTWLSAVTHGPGTEPSGPLGGLDALLRCDLGRMESAAAALDGDTTYWGLQIRILLARALGDGDASAAIRAAEIRAPDVAHRAELGRASRPIRGSSPYIHGPEDFRLYRRPGTLIRPDSIAWPSVDEAWIAWLGDPGAAAQRGAPLSGLARCSTDR